MATGFLWGRCALAWGEREEANINHGWLVPLKNGNLALFFPSGQQYEPHPALGVAHVAHEADFEQKLSLFSPREVLKEELAQIEPFVHDVEYRIRARKFLGRAIYTPATEWLLGRFHFILQVFGIGGIFMCIYTGRYQPDDIALGIYWVLLLPMFCSIGNALMAWHGRETLSGLRRLYHSPIGIRVVVLPQLKKIAELLNSGEPYSKVLEQVRDLGLDELILFYRRASQYPRWSYGDGPNPCGIIRCPGR